MVSRVNADTSFQRQVKRRAREFDLPALVRLLRRGGYLLDEIFVESNAEQGGGPTLVHDVAFESAPRRRAFIIVNMGLLGSSSPLPSYFFELMEKATNPEPFEDFIHYFDNVLLRELVRSVAPEDDHQLSGTPAETKASYFGMLGPGSVATLTQVFGWYFPELGVDVCRHAFRQSTSAHACRTSISRLDGSGVIGKHYRSEAEGFRIELFCEEERTDDGGSWPDLVKLRLETKVLPLLGGARIPLKVALNVLAHETWAKLRREGHLGFERVMADEAGGHRMRIFSGFTGVAAPQRTGLGTL
jgi:hypothetical protein